MSSEVGNAISPSLSDFGNVQPLQLSNADLMWGLGGWILKPPSEKEKKKKKKKRKRNKKKSRYFGRTVEA